MGYKARRVYVLEFEDRDGMEVKARSTNIDRFMELTELADFSPGNSFSPEDRAKIDKLLAGFSECLVSWNLEEDDDSPIPATLEGLRSLDIDLAMEIVNSWMDAISDVSPGKERPSPNGSQSVEASIPMEPLSPSQSS